MNEEFDEPPVDLSPLNIDAERRAERIAARVSSRVAHARTEPNMLAGVELVLARWAVPATLAAAASLAFVVLTTTRPEGEMFAALVLSHGPAVGWIASGRPPDFAEVASMVGGRQ